MEVQFVQSSSAAAASVGVAELPQNTHQNQNSNETNIQITPLRLESDKDIKDYVSEAIADFGTEAETPSETNLKPEVFDDMVFISFNNDAVLPGGPSIVRPVTAKRKPQKPKRDTVMTTTPSATTKTVRPAWNDRIDMALLKAHNAWPSISRIPRYHILSKHMKVDIRPVVNTSSTRKKNRPTSVKQSRCTASGGRTEGKDSHNRRPVGASGTATAIAISQSRSPHALDPILYNRSVSSASKRRRYVSKERTRAKSAPAGGKRRSPRPQRCECLETTTPSQRVRCKSASNDAKDEAYNASLGSGSESVPKRPPFIPTSRCPILPKVASHSPAITHSNITSPRPTNEIIKVEMQEKNRDNSPLPYLKQSLIKEPLIKKPQITNASVNDEPATKENKKPSFSQSSRMKQVVIKIPFSEQNVKEKDKEICTLKEEPVVRMSLSTADALPSTEYFPASLNNENGSVGKDYCLEDITTVPGVTMAAPANAASSQRMRLNGPSNWTRCSFIVRQDEMASLKSYIFTRKNNRKGDESASGSSVIIIAGPAGSGRTSLLARFALDITSITRGNTKLSYLPPANALRDIVFHHFAFNSAPDIWTLLLSLHLSLDRPDDEFMRGDGSLAAVRACLDDELSAILYGCRLIGIIDDADCLTLNGHVIPHLAWLGPSVRIASRVKIVLSVRTDSSPAEPSVSNMARAIQQEKDFRRFQRCINLAPLHERECRELVEELAQSASRKLTFRDVQSVVKRPLPHCRHPIYFVAAMEETRWCTMSSNAESSLDFCKTAQALPRTIDGLLGMISVRLSSYIGRSAATALLSMLIQSPHGISKEVLSKVVDDYASNALSIMTMPYLRHIKGNDTVLLLPPGALRMVLTGDKSFNSSQWLNLLAKVSADCAAENMSSHDLITAPPLLLSAKLWMLFIKSLSGKNKLMNLVKLLQFPIQVSCWLEVAINDSPSEYQEDLKKLQEELYEHIIPVWRDERHEEKSALIETKTNREKALRKEAEECEKKILISQREFMSKGANKIELRKQQLQKLCQEVDDRNNSSKNISERKSTSKNAASCMTENFEYQASENISVADKKIAELILSTELSSTSSQLVPIIDTEVVTATMKDERIIATSNTSFVTDNDFNAVKQDEIGAVNELDDVVKRNVVEQQQDEAKYVPSLSAAINVESNISSHEDNEKSDDEANTFQLKECGNIITETKKDQDVRSDIGLKESIPDKSDKDDSDHLFSDDGSDLGTTDIDGSNTRHTYTVGLPVESVVQKDIDTENEESDEDVNVTVKQQCKRAGCGKKFQPLLNGPKSCVYHPGSLESSNNWSCCQGPALEQGCTTGRHE